VGGVIGGVLVIAIVVIAACFIMRRKSNAEKATNKFTDLSVVRYLYIYRLFLLYM
jgi:hypothetical protein